MRKRTMVPAAVNEPPPAPVQVHRQYAHRFVEHQPKGKDRHGDPKAPYRLCEACGHRADSAPPWCTHLLAPVGIGMATTPDGTQIPTHRLGDDVARDIVSGRVPLATAQEWERRRSEHVRGLASRRRR